MKQKGLSLIELLIVLAIMGIVSLMGASFGGGWVDSNRVLDGENLFNRAFTLAKATSLRNKDSAVSGEAAAIVCLNNNKLSVHTQQVDAAPLDCSSTDIAWETAIHPRLDILNSNNLNESFTCACLNNRGRLTTLSAECNNCATENTTYNITSGAENVAVTLN